MTQFDETHRNERRTLEPVHADEAEGEDRQWGSWLILFLRVMAVVSLCKGLYHWGVICGIKAPFPSGFDAYALPYQVATVFFAVIDLVAGVGLWLAAPWGAVVWLTSVISMAAVEVLFPQIYGGHIVIVLIDLALLGTYIWLVLMAAREQQE
jgi:hypothetical protein